MVSFPITLNDPNLGFKVTVLCEGEYFKTMNLCNCRQFIYLTPV